jgi:transcriptional regulator with XRE-family HTH domain
VDEGRRVKQFRDKHGWTQATLARKVRVSRVTIGRVEIGYSRPSRALLKRLAKVFKTTPENLAGGTAMHEVRAFIEVTPNQFASIAKVMQDEALTITVLNTALHRLEALAEEMALEVRGMKVLGAIDAERQAERLLEAAIAGERFKTPYVANIAVKTGREESIILPTPEGRAGRKKKGGRT